jgi:hypothetical protein
MDHNSLAHISGIFTPKTEPGRGARTIPGSPSVGPKVLRDGRRSWDERAARVLPHNQHWYDENVPSLSGGRPRLRTRDQGREMVIFFLMLIAEV